MILESPALALNIDVQSLVEIVDKTLKERNWKHYETVDFKLVYTPYYLFNYDVLIEQKEETQTFSQGTSGLMAINAVTGKLEPHLVQIMDSQPVKYDKNTKDDLNPQVDKPAITMQELPDTCKIKMAGQFGVGKESLAVSGFRLTYWPVWRVFVSLPEGIQKMEVEGVNGYTLNIEEVPEREKGWLEVTADTFEKMKTPAGLMELTKGAGKFATGAATKSSSKTPEHSQGIIHWIFYTTPGRFSLFLVIILIIVSAYLGV
jgi:hypothetical protein